MVYNLVKFGNEYYKHNKWNREEVLKYSEGKFRELVKYAYENSEFYNEYYLKNGIKYDDLNYIKIEDIPPITKEMVRENLFKISTKKINEEKFEKEVLKEKMLHKVKDMYIAHSSGSTTGFPTTFLYEKKALDILEANFVRLSIGGENNIAIKDFPIKSLYVASVGGGYACTLISLYGMKQYKCKSIIIDAKEPLSKWKSKIEDYGPCYLCGYPSCINIIAKLQESDKINIKPKKIIAGGEPLLADEMKNYKDIFGADVIDHYGCTESIFIGAGTSYYKGIYLFDDLNYVEVDNNQKLIITPLYNPNFPIIRYKLNDVMEEFDKNYSGVLPYTHVKRVVGRSEDLMWFTNEKGEDDFLHPLFIDDLNVKGIQKYQFEKRNNTSFILRYEKVAGKDVDEKQIRAQINQFLNRKMMNNLSYKIIMTDKIDVDPKTGKSKLVVNSSK